MNGFGVQILLVVILVTSVEQFPTAPGASPGASPDAPNFEAALRIVNDAKGQPGNIHYKGGFCEGAGIGTQKFGCQIKAMKDVGLVVCLGIDKYAVEVCLETLQYQMIYLKKVRDANLKVIAYHDQIINR